MTILFITMAVIATAYVFYSIGYNQGEMDGYTNAVNDGWEVNQ